MMLTILLTGLDRMGKSISMLLRACGPIHAMSFRTQSPRNIHRKERDIPVNKCDRLIEKIKL